MTALEFRVEVDVGGHPEPGRPGLARTARQERRAAPDAAPATVPAVC